MHTLRSSPHSSNHSRTCTDKTSKSLAMASSSSLSCKAAVSPPRSPNLSDTLSRSCKIDDDVSDESKIESLTVDDDSSQIFSDLEQKIVKRLARKIMLSMLIYGKPEFRTLSSQTAPRFDINAPILDGMFPLHLAVMTSSEELVGKLLESYRTKLDVKCCGDPDSPFYGLTPLEMALKIIRNLIPWDPQMSVHELISMFHGNEKVVPLMVNIYNLVSVTPQIRHLIAEYSLQGKVVEFAALLMVACSYPIDFSTMYIPTANIPPELHFGVPIMLRLLVATKSASVIKEGIQLSASLNPEEYDNCIIKIKQMDSIRTLLESAERGDLNGFDVKQQLTVELTDDSSEGSKDESKVSTTTPEKQLVVR